MTDFFAILIKTSPSGLIGYIKITKAMGKVKDVYLSYRLS